MVEKADIDFGWTRPPPEEAFTYGYQAEMRHFVECVCEGRTPRETYEDGYAVSCIPKRTCSGEEGLLDPRAITFPVSSRQPC